MNGSSLYRRCFKFEVAYFGNRVILKDVTAPSEPRTSLAQLFERSMREKTKSMKNDGNGGNHTSNTGEALAREARIVEIFEPRFGFAQTGNFCKHVYAILQGLRPSEASPHDLLSFTNHSD